ncbi:hypothetical protein CO692_02790 [Enterococcus sp. FDAARGOS_375]|nr:hypothetical protein CO692_02790 [Enterococcus sp. FDAARGOS_375]
MPSCVPTNDTELVPQRMHANQLRTNPYKSQKRSRISLERFLGIKLGESAKLWYSATKQGARAAPS